MIRKRYRFTGKVQHVGFRWHARKAAEFFGCTGWCRNNPDGSVTMELQGSRAKTGLVILSLRTESRIRIDHTDVTVLPLIPDEQEFRSEY